ncbi:hypothetical protein E4U21_000638 [Claviceps maximensis]|nr:hypothetical protein E4U21_000638 [Claviceps maximensis]
MRQGCGITASINLNAKRQSGQAGIQPHECQVPKGLEMHSLIDLDDATLLRIGDRELAESEPSLDFRRLTLKQQNSKTASRIAHPASGNGA